MNDSGDSGDRVRAEHRGRVVGTLQYRAKPIDVEAVAMHDGRLYVADIGDNRPSGSSITVYYFNNASPDDRTVSYHSWDFAYPDGAHDAETLLVDDVRPAVRRDQGRIGGGVRRAAPTRAAGTNELAGRRRAGGGDRRDVPARREPHRAADLRLDRGDRRQDLRDVGAGRPSCAGPGGVAHGQPGRVLAAGRQRGPAVKGVRHPDPAGDRRPPRRPHRPSSDPDPEPDAVRAGRGGGSTGRSRAGTLLALGLAGIVAGVAGGVVALVRRP